MTRALLLGCVVVLTACGGSQHSDAKQQIADQLKDPASAQFRNVRASTLRDTDVCGEVNAKNSFGGYTGFKRFVVTDSGAFLEGQAGEEGDAYFDVLWSGGCSV